jgi:hypothetical protein
MKFTRFWGNALNPSRPTHRFLTRGARGGNEVPYKSTGGKFEKQSGFWEKAGGLFRKSPPTFLTSSDMT